jgi:tetratricopeptide (TPR) repeat protein
MDAARTGTCGRCGRANPMHALWCRQCGMALSLPWESASDAHPQDKPLAATIELYRRVLEDLQNLADEEAVPNETYETISRFYMQRLRAKRAQEEARRRSAVVRKYVDRARSLVHVAAPRFQEAIYALQQGIQEFPDEPIFRELVQEIRAEAEKRAQAARAMETTRNLFEAAKACWQRGEFEASEARLREALDLVPGNPEILAALDRVQRSRAEQRRRGPVLQPTSSPPSLGRRGSEDVVEADLLQPASTTRPKSIREETLAEQPRQMAGAAATRPQTLRAGSGTAQTAAARSFAEEEEIPSPAQRWVEAVSEWSQVLKPFLIDNVGWFVGAFLIVAGFVVLITTFWQNIEENQILMASLVFVSLVAATGFFFAVAYFMRVKRPALETSSNVLLIIVSLLIPLVFAAAALTTLVPPAG